MLPLPRFYFSIFLTVLCIYLFIFVSFFRKERDSRITRISRDDRFEISFSLPPRIIGEYSGETRRESSCTTGSACCWPAVCRKLHVFLRSFFCFLFLGRRREGGRTIQLVRDRLRDVATLDRVGKVVGELASTVCRRVTIIIYQEIQSLFSTLRIVQSVKRYLRRDRGWWNVYGRK